MLKYANYDIVFQEVPDEVTLAINISNCPNHISEPIGVRRKTKNTTTVTTKVMILPRLPTRSFDDKRTKTKKAKMRHIPMMVRKPKDKPVSKIGQRMFQKVYFLLRMR